MFSNLPGGGGKKPPLPIPVPPPIPDPTGAIERIFEYLKEKEKQKTEREKIRKATEIIKKAIDTYSEKFEEIFTQRVEERNKKLDKFFKVVDHALETGNLRELELGLWALLELEDKPILSKEDRKVLSEIFKSIGLGAGKHRQSLPEPHDGDGDDVLPAKIVF
jgi:hypothetical protein